MDPFVALAIAIFPEIVAMVLANPSDDIRNKISQAVKDATVTTSIEDARAKLNDPRQAAVVVDLKDRLKKIASAAGVPLTPVGTPADTGAPDVFVAQADENTQKAREMMLSLATINESQMSTPAIISYIVVIGFIALVFMLVTGHAPGLVSSSADGAMSQVANLCIGALATSFATVLNFWLGSSLGSRRKDAPAAQASAVEQTQKINEALKPATT